MKIRRLKPDEFDQAVKLADETFRDGGHTSMGEAFPQVFSKELQLSYGAFDGEKLVSFIGLVPSIIRIGSASLNIFSIGAVCTDMSYRKQGISTRILKEIYQSIDNAGASLLLISGDRGLYTRNDCYHFGSMKKFTLEANVKRAIYDGSVRKGTEADIFSVHQLNKNKKVRYESSVWEWAMLLKAGGFASIFKKDQALFVAEKDNEIKGYAVIGLQEENNGTDNGIVMEWGGDPQAVHGIFQDMLMGNYVSKLELAVTWQDELQQELHAYQNEERKNGGTVYIVNRERFIDQAFPYLKEQNPEISKPEILESINALTPKEFVKKVFDPNENAESVFPLPMPSTEGLNYV
ncbi:hypothetical protein CIL03_11795 [Virgibacillus indicus]|uniref:N-acetyltransferase domain-containing protein n=1 Tax=Virgibacillus indicus TaxID=2024554 RepID=A0A265N912_9BACI|nr:GNAT family N-acetyltransferase [Virgibacillus indicus]OZU88327.1 hypothetical protein CIL03_11795 [Virgibacillus indicus]